MSSESNSDEIPVNVLSENQQEADDSKSSKTLQPNIEELSKLLDLEKQKVTEYEDKIKTCVGRLSKS